MLVVATVRHYITLHYLRNILNIHEPVIAIGPGKVNPIFVGI